MERVILKASYKDNDVFDYLLASDLHLDEPGFNAELFHRDFDEALARKARIMLAGDVFGLILPKDFKRYTRGNDQSDTDAHVNQIVERGVALLGPYADYIDMIGCGNHETAVLRHHAVDSIKILVFMLNQLRSKSLPPIRYGGYSGFVRLKYEYASGGHTQSLVIWYNHGQGGSAEVTDGIIGLKRRQYIAADIIWQGHVHKKLFDEMNSEIGLTQQNRIYERKKYGLITGSYLKNVAETNADKDGYRLNYAEQEMRTTQGTGGVFLRATVSRSGVRYRAEVGN